MSPSPTADSGTPTSGELLLYGLGQLYRQWRVGEKGAVRPRQIDVEAVARFLGLWHEVEFVQEDEEDSPLTFLHLPDEVLVIDPRDEFPWQLFDPWEWAKAQEIREFWRYFH